MGFTWVFFAFTQTRCKECPRNVQAKPKQVKCDGTSNLLVRSNCGKAADTLRHSINTGTPLNRDYGELKAALQPYHERTLALKAPSELSANEQLDTALVRKVKRIFFAHMDSMVPVRFAFVKSHPSSLLSLEALNDLVRDSRWLDEVEQNFKGLSPELKA